MSTRRVGVWRRLAVTLLLGLLAGAARAIGPHEVLLLANSASADSVAVAALYARQRGIPELNCVEISVPEKLLRRDAMTPAEFTRHIWEPATALVRARGLERQVLAWVYAPDFPTRIETSPTVSLTGLTFLRNRLPPRSQIEEGTYASALFGAPLRPRASAHAPQTFDAFSEWLGADMPLPAMMLGVLRGQQGNSRAEVEACLARGLASDGTQPTGTVWFVQTEDVRSRCRIWQHPAALAALSRMGVAVQTSTGEPLGATAVMGMQVGAPTVMPSRNQYAPGAMVEHLTSAGGIFDQSYQTALTAWITAGATASSGTVVEPYALWTKFPSAHFHVFYAAGCTMIESFYQSIRCPLQILLVGDPLASPWKPRDRLRVLALEAGSPAVTTVLRPAVESASGVDYRRFKYYVDGREVHEGPNYVYDPVALSAAGGRVLRVVGYRAGLLRQQVYGEWLIAK